MLNSDMLSHTWDRERRHYITTISYYIQW